MNPRPTACCRPLFRASLVSLSAFLLLLPAQIARAVSGTWSLLSTGNATGNWIDTTTGNWSGGTVAGGSGFIADFSTLDITANSTVTLTAPRTIGTLIFGDTSTTTAANWTLAGTGANILTLAGTTPTITVNAMASSAATSANVTISAQISGTSGFIKNGTGTNSATTTGSVNGTGTLTINSASNNYSGITDIQTGTLRGTNASSFGTSTVTVENGARLFLSGTGVTYANAVNLNGTDALAIGGGGLATVSLSNTVTLQSNSSAWVTNVGGNSTLTFTSAGTLALGSNVLSINSAGSTATTIAGTLTGGATSGININGSGVTTMSGNGSGYSGTTTTINGNGVTIQLGSDTALGTGTLALNPGNNNTVTVLSLNATARTTAVAVTLDNSTTPTYAFGSAGTGNLTFTNTTAIALSSVRQIQVLNSQTEFDAAFTGSGGGITKSGTGTLLLNGANTYTGATTISAGTLQLGNGGTTGKLSTSSAITNNGNLTIKRSDAVAQGTDFSTAAITGTGSFTQAGGGTTTLNVVNSYSGATTISGGKLTIASAGTINSTSGVSIGAGEFNYNSSTALSKSVSFSGTGGKLSGSGTITPAVTVTSGNTLAPGNSIGTLSFGSGLTLAGTYSVELGTPNASAASGLSDRAAGTGALSLGGNLTLVDNANANSQGSAGAGAYRIATYTTTLTGTFGSVTNPLSATLHEQVVYGAASGGGAVDLNLYRLATGSTSSTLALGNARVGDTLSGSLSVGNSATNDGFSEKLNASIGTNTGNVSSSSGSISALAAGGSSTAISAALDTTTAGAKSGTATVSYVSNGTGTSGYGTTANGSTVVTVSGAVYNPASANTIATPVNLGIVRVSGSFGSSALSISNTAAAGSFTEGLNATKGSTTADASVSGTNISNLAGGSSLSTISVGLGAANTSIAGAKSGTVAIGLASSGTNSGLSDLALTGQTVTVNGQVNEYAAPLFNNISGASLTGSGTAYTVDFGTHATGTGTLTATINLSNSVVNASFQDALKGAFNSTSANAAGFSFSGLTLTSLSVGASQGITASFVLDGVSAGTYTGNLIFSGLSSNASDLSGAALSDITLAYTINIAAIPEPTTYAAIFGALALAGAALRRRRN